MNIIIDTEFAALCPPLTPEEFANLEASIIMDGCRDVLAIWKEQGILLDGHNRKRICEANGITYQTIGIPLADREAAITWIITNQLGRRNLSPDQTSLLRGRLYNLQKKAAHAGENQYTRGEYQNDTQLNTAQRLGAQFGVSAPTIKRDAQFAHDVEVIKPFVPDIENRVMVGDIPSREAIHQLAKEPAGAAQAMAVTVYSSKSNEYYTPVEILDAAKRVLGGIDLDPASCEDAQKNVGATRYYTKEDDGLAHDWIGRVWLNPPYGKTEGKSNTGIWAQKMVSEYVAGDITEGLLLVKAALGYVWFEYLFSAWPVCFLRSRLSFISDDGNDDGQSKQGTAIFYFGKNFTRFATIFRELGRVIPPEAILNVTMFG